MGWALDKFKANKAKAQAQPEQKPTTESKEATTSQVKKEIDVANKLSEEARVKISQDIEHEKRFGNLTKSQTMQGDKLSVQDFLQGATLPKREKNYHRDSIEYNPIKRIGEEKTIPLERIEKFNSLQDETKAPRQRSRLMAEGADDDFYQTEYGLTQSEYDIAKQVVAAENEMRQLQYKIAETSGEVETLDERKAEIDQEIKQNIERKQALIPLIDEYRAELKDVLKITNGYGYEGLDWTGSDLDNKMLEKMSTMGDEELNNTLNLAAFRKSILPRIKELEVKAYELLPKEKAEADMVVYSPAPGFEAMAKGTQSIELLGKYKSSVEGLKDLYESVKNDDFSSGFYEGTDWLDMISSGFAGLFNRSAILNAIHKQERGQELTDEDKFFLEVAELESALEDWRKSKGGASWQNNVGSGLAHTTQFMAETAMTGGLGGGMKLATSGVKGAFKLGVKQGVKRLMLRNIPKTVGYGATRSAIMPTTYSNILDRRIDQYSIVNGEVELTNPESILKSIGVAWTDQTFEISSELWGGFLAMGFGKVGKILGVNKLSNTLRKSKVGNVLSIKTTPAWRRALRDGVGWTGDMPSEITSEFLGDVATNLAYEAFNEDETYWEKLGTWDYWSQLGVTVAGLKAGFTVASLPNSIAAHREIKKLEARSAAAFNAIGNEELKNMVLNLGGRTDIEDVSEYMHSIDWSQYEPMQVAHAIDYMMSEVERQVVAGSESEQERAALYAPRLERIQQLSYRNAEGVAMPTMVTAEANFGADNTQSVTILEGDYSNPDAMVSVLLDDGTMQPIIASKLSNVQETDMAALVAEDYAKTFAEEEAMETLGEVEQTLSDMQRTGASNTQQIRAVEKAGLTVFNEGEQVTLLNGEEAMVVGGFRHGLYTVARADGSLSMVGIGGILQPDAAIAQAQRSAAMPQEQTPLTQSAPLPEDIDTTADYATPDGFVGKAVDYNAESDQVTLQSADGGLTNVPRASLTTANAEQIAPQEDITEDLATETISEMEQSEAEEAPMPVAPQTAPIPQNEDGSVDYESMTDATMYANALESDMGNVADAQEAVADVRQSKEAELAKLQEQKKQTANMNEKVALRQQEQRLVQQIAMLNEVESILGSRATAIEAENAQVNKAVETAPIAEATTEQTAPTTEPTRAESEGVKDNYLATRLLNENPAEYNTFNAIAKLLGLEIEFVESAGEGNALIVGNKMQVAYNPANRDEALRFLIGHESLHRLKQVAPEAYAELMEDVKAYMGEELFGRRKERLQQRYAKQGIAITEESLEEEVVADFIGEMEEDYNVVSDLATQNPNKSWWQKLIEGLRNLFSFLEEAEADTTKVASILNKIETAYKTAAEKVQTLEVETVNGEVSAEEVKNSLREGTDEATDKIFATAKAKFGTTYDMREAGWILPDGSMLDFSGKHEIQDADTSFLNGCRTVDHRTIQDIAYDFDENETGVKTDLGDFLDRGAIRIDDNTGSINLNVAPTKVQKDRLKRLIERNGGDVYIDFGKGWNTEHYVEYESARPSRVLGDIDRYFDEGIKPTGNVRFSLKDDNAIDNLHKASNTIRKWVENDVRGKSFRIELPEYVTRQIRREMGQDFDSHNITANGIAHALKNHGENGKKLTEKSIPIRKEDAELIPYIMAAPSYVRKGSTKNNRDSVRYYKTISNGYVVVIEKELDNSVDDLETINMWAELSDVSNAASTTLNRTPETTTTSRSDIAKIIKDAETAIENEQKLKYSLKDTFYSNAEFAVRNIKQEKATPEQWLKMIEKNGGLKAGEDKWLGLSDWLKYSDKKTLTKDEVLQYIAENDIQIEEVQYSETNAELLDRVGELTNDLYYIDESINSLSESISKGKQRLKTLTDAKSVFDEKAEALKQEYGEDSPEYQNHIFYDSYTDDIESLEVSITQDEEYYKTQSERADALRSELEMLNEEIGDEREINSTRLQYTTKGLEDKREIALTVPTIEPWNTNDEIHFGDAGGGRAVAWIRFGETTALTDEAIAAKKAVGDYLASMREKYGSKEGEETDAMTADEIDHLQSLTAKEIESRENGLRVLVIDEIQSKRHQEGREKGYRDVEAEKREKAERERELTEVVLPRLAELNQLYNEKYGVGKWRDTEYDRQWRPRRVYRFLTPEEQAEHESLSIRATELQTTMPRRDGIPSAPFEKNWAELAMKRMLRYAAENGFDKVAWATGEQQAERYNIGNVVTRILSYEGQVGGKEVKHIELHLTDRSRRRMAVDANGFVVSSEGDFVKAGTPLADVVGKEVARKILDGKGEDAMIVLRDSKEGYTDAIMQMMRKYGVSSPASMNAVISAEDKATLDAYVTQREVTAKEIDADGLRIGGEGMKAFYDQMLPSFMRKYAKKWGATVGEVTMPNLEENNTMHSVDVTPAMRESVMQGQPMFSLRNLTEEDQNIIATAKANGTYLKAPNGADTNLTPRQWVQVRTKAFKQWFGDWENDPENASKIVDENGEPMVMAHGSKNNFTVFRSLSPRGTSGRGMYFAKAPNNLDNFGYNNGVVYLCFLNVRHPYTHELGYSRYKGTDAAAYTKDDSGQSIDEAIMNLIIGANSYEQFIDDYNQLKDNRRLPSINNISKERFQKIHNYFDGKGIYGYELHTKKRLLGKNKVSMTIDPNMIGEVVVRDASQIKSATDNAGTFDVNNPDIRYSLRNPEWQSQFGVPLADGKELSLEDVRTIFEKTNKGKFYQKIFDRVYAVMEKLPRKVIKVVEELPDKRNVLGTASTKGDVTFRTVLFKDYGADIVSQAILHELIHSVTTYATHAYAKQATSEKHAKAYDALPTEIKKACRELQSVYNRLSKKNDLKGAYGIKNINEMLAELSNPQFRTLVEEGGFWKVLLNALKRMFGFEGTYNAELAELDNILSSFLENYNEEAYMDAVESIYGEDIFTTIEEVDAKEMRKPFGGNSGYVGYSMSKRAAYAREEGRYPKTDFKKVYNMPQATLDALVKEGVIYDKEWHHTSVYGNKTIFYGWGDDGEYPELAELYKERKKSIDKAVKDGADLSSFVEMFSKREEEIFEQRHLEYLAEVERVKQNVLARQQREEYIRKHIPSVIKASNGAEVYTNNSPYLSDWVATKDGERLSKRNRKEERDVAFNEVLKIVSAIGQEYDVASATSSLKDENKPLEEQYNALKETDNQGKERYSVKEVNNRFNEELQQQIDGTLPQGHIYQLGMPSPIMLACKFPDIPIELSSTNLANHAREPKHPFELLDVKDLVLALQKPIAVFVYGDESKSQNVIIEITKNKKNFLVGIHFNQAQRGMVVSDIRGIFPKDNAEWLNWIQQGKSKYLDKEKLQALINQQRKTLAEVKYLDLDSVTKIIQDFENPKIEPKYSLKSFDAPYLDAVARGDMATAERMVREAAAIAMPNTKVVDEDGLPKIVEHSTWNDDFYTFDINHLGESSGDEGVYGAGFYFGNIGETELYGDRAIRVYLNLHKPLVLPDAPIRGFFDYLVENFDKEGLRDMVVKQGNKATTMGDVVDAIKAVNEAHARGEYAELIEQMSQYWYPAEDRVLEQQIFRKIGFAIYPTLEPFIQYNVGRKEFSEALRNAGYDGVGYNNQEYIAFEPNQIKSADVVTYDDAGNIIPLSERFNPEKEDIRYSLREATGERLTPAMIRHHMMENVTRHHEREVNRINRFYDREVRQAEALAKKARKEAGLVYPKNGKITDRLAFLIPDGKGVLPIALQVTYDIANGLKLKWSDSKDGRKHGLSSELGLGSSRKEGYGAITIGATMYVEDYVNQLMEENNGYARDLDDNDIRNAVINVLTQYTKPKQAIQALEDIFLNDEMDDAEAEALYKIEQRRQEALEEEKKRYETLKLAYYQNPFVFEREYFSQMEQDIRSLNFKEREIRHLRLQIKGLRKRHAESKYEQAARIERVRKRITDMVGTYFGRNMNAAEIKTLVNLISKAHTSEALERALDMIQRQDFNVQYRMQRQRKGRLLQNRISFAFTDNEMSVEQYLRQEGVDDATIKRLLSNRFKGVDAKGISVAKFVSAEVAKLMELVNEHIALAAPQEQTNRDTIDQDIEKQYTAFVDALNEAAKDFPADLLNNTTLGAIIEQLPAVMRMYWQADAMIKSAKSYESDLQKLNKEIKEAEEYITFRPENMSNEAYYERVQQGTEFLQDRINLRNALMRQHLADMPSIVQLMTEANNAIEQMLLGGKQLLSEERKALEQHKRDVVQDALDDITNFGEETGRIEDKRAKNEHKVKWLQTLRNKLKKHTWNIWIYSLDYVLNKLAPYSRVGEGMTHQRIVGEWMDATNMERANMQEVTQTIDDKIKSLWGKQYRTLNDLMTASQSIKVATVTYVDTDKGIRHLIDRGKRSTEWVESERTIEKPLTMGEALYLLASWEQASGRMKLEAHGITADEIAGITRAIGEIDSRWLEMKDWVVQELLPERREHYDAQHRKLNGAYMARVDNYFPIKIKKSEIHKEADVDAPAIVESSISPSAIINRTHNTKMIDLDVDFFKVMSENIATMEHWAAMEGVRRDINAILSNQKLRNLMDSEFGEDFHPAFLEAARTALGTLVSEAPKGFEKVLYYLTRKWAGSRISGRVITAFKQIAGLPAIALYWRDAGFETNLLKNLGTFGVRSWNKAREVLPMLDNRLKQAIGGAVELADFYKRLDVHTESGVKRGLTTLDDVTDWLVRQGMKPNVWVDFWASSMIGLTVYETRKESYLKKGYPEAMAERKARMEAEAAYNKTQQSAELLYLAPAQVYKTILTRAAATFMNNSIANERLGAEGLRDAAHAIGRWQKLKHNIYTQESIRIYNECIANGMDEADARNVAGREARKIANKASRIGTIGRGVLQAAWGLFLSQYVFQLTGVAAAIWLGIGALDDDDEEKLADQAWENSKLAALTNVPVLNLGASVLAGKKHDILPAYTTMQKDIEALQKAIEDDDDLRALLTVADMAVSMGVGIDLNTAIDIADGIADMENGDWREGWMDVVSLPKSQVKLIVGKRRDDETAEEYMTRILRTTAIIDKKKIDEAELGKYNYQTGKWEEEPNITEGQKRYVTELYNQYQEEYKKDMLDKCLRTEGYQEVGASYTMMETIHAAILEELGVGKGKEALRRYRKADENDAYFDEMKENNREAYDTYKAMEKLQSQIREAENNMESLVTQDGKEYINALANRYNLMKQFAAKYEEYKNLIK